MDTPADLFLGVVEIEEFDLGARRHDRADRLGLRNVAGRHPFAQHEADLLVGHRRGFAAQWQQPQQQVGGRAQQPFDRRADPRHGAHEARQRRGNALGIDHRDALRHQLAEDQ